MLSKSRLRQHLSKSTESVFYNFTENRDPAPYTSVYSDLARHIIGAPRLTQIEVELHYRAVTLIGKGELLQQTPRAMMKMRGVPDD
jgi:hypothetical protein